jgi:hypothetical protein
MIFILSESPTKNITLSKGIIIKLHFTFVRLRVGNG